jgi:hypothetical protein
MSIFLVNSSNPNSKSLISKLRGAKDGGFIELTGLEMDLYKSDDFKIVARFAGI